ncbi:YkyA family protein [Sinobaca sp. H24]|uniref:YkyA family protein n=1 Tax=Sinobaca sp. H24 TaxID=2923376 RepID=UPI00207A87A4|nr:YkyA family protein [Sinobaca sp. H24]
MPIHKKTAITYTAIGAVLLLGGCGGSPEEQMQNSLEGAAEAEEEFAEQQQPMMDLHEEEQSLFASMQELSVEEMDEIESQSEEAVSLAEERESHLETEKESIESSYEEFQQGIESGEEAEADLSSELQAAQESMEGRYNAYQNLNEAYAEGIDRDKELYEALTNENLTVDELQDQIAKVNESYTIVADEQEQFNTYTDQYNEAKTSLYEAAGIEQE